jgi:hypothetical protein
MPLDKIAVALRVLNAIKRSAPPTQTDLDTLKAWVPLDDRVLPPDGIARLVMNRELAHTKINYQ